MIIIQRIIIDMKNSKTLTTKVESIPKRNQCFCSNMSSNNIIAVLSFERDDRGVERQRQQPSSPGLTRTVVPEWVFYCVSLYAQLCTSTTRSKNSKNGKFELKYGGFLNEITMTSYPIGSSVLLHNLVGASQLNGTKGIVKGGNNGGGRQEVYVFEAQKSMAIKVENLTYEPRTIQSLTISEMKGILRVLTEEDACSTDSIIAGMDKEALRMLVEESISEKTANSGSPVEIKIAELIARANKPPSSITTATTATTAAAAAQAINSDQLRQGVERMASMSPDDLRKQATTMRAMGPAAMRAMNPQMANMTDAQIEMAIAQMEAVANDPNQLKMAAEQMKNMSESELTRALEQQTAMMGGAGGNSSSSSSSSSGGSGGSGGRTSTTAAFPSFSAAQLEQATKQMSSMSPEQLRQQSTMLRSMPFSTLRTTNPHMANMSDAQIEQSIAQLEMMANNPEMLRMATESMKGLTSEQLATMQEQMANILGGSEGGGGGGGGDLGSGLFTDPTKLNSAVKAMKQNPDILKQMLGGGGGGGGGAGAGGSSSSSSSMLSDTQMAQMNNMIDSFTTMDDERLEKYLHVANVMQRTVVAPFMKTKDALGLSTRMGLILVWIGMTIVTCTFGLFVWQWWFGSKKFIQSSLHDSSISILSENDLPPNMSNDYNVDSEF